MTWLDALGWREPLYLLALLMPLLLLLWRNFSRHSAQQAYADKHLWPRLQLALKGDAGARKWHSISSLSLLILAWSSLVIALAGPKIYQQGEKDRPLQGIDIMLVMDLSRSMLVKEDTGHSRFETTQLLAESCARQLQPQDRLGLMAFAGSSHLVSPLVFDKDLIIKDLKLLYPGLIPLDGSWLQPALIRALQHLQNNQGALGASKIEQRPKLVIVMGDGREPFLKPVELPDDIRDLPLQDWLNEDSVYLDLLGFGSLEPKAVPDSRHPSGLMHFFGLPVTSALQEGSLQKWAEEARHGVYWRSDGNLQPLLDELKVARAGSVKQSLTENLWQWQDIGPWFILAGLLFLMLAFIPRLRWLILAIALLLSYQLAQADEKTAFQLYQDNEFVKAQQEYIALAAQVTPQKAYSAWFGAGASAYKAQDYVSAVLYFRQAAWLAESEDLRAKALFNLGNTYYKANLPSQSVEAYQQALRYLSPYPQAEHNLQLALQRQKKEQELQRKKQSGDDAEGESSGKGEQQEGAFYGGQKPKSSSSDEEGVGADGDALGGNRSGDKPPLPQTTDHSLYRLDASGNSVNLTAQGSSDSIAGKIQQQEKQLKNAREFAAEISTLQAQQQRLLKRLFEAEAGFHAEQKETHSVPGVQPW